MSITTIARRASIVLLVLTIAGLMAPTDLIQVRGRLLHGLVGSYNSIYRVAKTTKLMDSSRDTICTLSTTNPLSGDQSFNVPITSWTYQGAQFNFSLVYHSESMVDPAAAGIPFLSGLSESANQVMGVPSGNIKWTHSFCQWVDLYQDTAGNQYAVWHQGDGTRLSFPYNGTIFTAPDSYHTISYATSPPGCTVTSPPYDNGGTQTNATIPYAGFAITDADKTEYDFNAAGPSSPINPPGNSVIPMGCPAQPYLFWTTAEGSAVPHYLLDRIRDRWGRTLYINWKGLTGKMGEVEPRITSVTDNGSPATTYLLFSYTTTFTLTPGQIAPLLTAVQDVQGRTHTFNYTGVQDNTGAYHPKLTGATVYGPGAGPGNCNRTVESWSFAYADSQDGVGLSSPSYGGSYTGDLLISKGEPDGNVRGYGYNGVNIANRMTDGTQWDGVLSQASWQDSSEGPTVTKVITRSAMDTGMQNQVTLSDPYTSTASPGTSTVSTFEDATDNLLTQQDTATGRTWTYKYDGDQNLTDTWTPVEPTSGNPLAHYAYSFSTPPQISQITETVLQSVGGALGDPVWTCLNGFNEPTEIVAQHRSGGMYSLDEGTKYGYDGTGNLMTVQDGTSTGVPPGNSFNSLLETDLGYTGTGGAFGLPTSVTDAAIAATSTLSYDPNNNYLLSSVSSPQNLSLSSSDPDYPASTTSVLSYNVDGLPTLVQDPLGHQVAISYGPDTEVNGNPANLRVTYAYPDMSSSSALLDPDGHVLQTVNEEGVVTQWSYNPAGQVKTVTEAVGLPEQRTTTYHYDSHGDLSSIDQPTGGSVTFEYTGYNQSAQPTGIYEGQVTHVHYPDGTDDYFGYEPVGTSASGSAGELAWERKPDGLVVNLTRDQLHRVMQISYPASGTYFSGFNIIYTYDEFGRVTGRKDEGGQYTYGYDYLDRLTGVTPPNLPFQSAISYSYLPSATSHQWTTQFTLNDVGTYQYQEDTKGRTHQVVNPFNQTFVLNHDLDSKPTSTLFANGTQEQYGYTNRDWLSSITFKQQNGLTYDTLNYYYTDGGGTYHPTGHLQREIDGAGRTHAFTYDHLYQLVQESHPDFGTIGYSYDANGNRLTKTTSQYTDYYHYLPNNKLCWVNRNSNSIPTAGQTTPYTLFGYDADGRMNYRDRRYDSGTRQNYNLYWDSDDRLRGIIPVGSMYFNFETCYDGDGLRTQEYDTEGLSHYFNWGPGGVLWDNNGNGSATYTPGLSYRQNSSEPDYRDYYYHTDWLGSTRYESDSTGNTFMSEGRSDGFGLGAAGNAAGSENGFLYGATSGYWTEPSTSTDPGLGLDYLEQRYYDPSIGRFISPDPIGFSGGLNLYDYTGNDPVNGVDPDGRGWKRITGSIVGGFLGGLAGSFEGGIGAVPGAVVGATAGGYFGSRSEGAHPGRALVNGAVEGGLTLAGAQATQALRVALILRTAGREGVAAGLEGAALNNFLGRAGERALGILVGGEKTNIFTSSGLRREVDRLVGGVFAHEAKVGLKDTISAGIERQITRDAQLLAEGKLREVTWHFFRNPVTGTLGPTARLRAALVKAGIKCVIHRF